MRTFIIVLLSTVIFYIPALYAENVTLCNSPDSITKANPQIQLRYNETPIMTERWIKLPAPGKCVSVSLDNSRTYFSGKQLDVYFSYSSALMNFNIGNVTFDNAADFDNCMLDVQYISSSPVGFRARAGKGCLSFKGTIPFKKTPLKP
ncbi:MAG: hypothetical protein KAH18_13405 [Psychromonas sp.]|nr:hypothetical protein [Psychromonas sp.]